MSYPSDLWHQLQNRLTSERRRRFQAVAAERTHRVRLVLADLHDPHNISACLRSAEGLGVQQVDVVAVREKFRPTSVATGVAKWLTLKQHGSIAACAEALAAENARILVGMPDESAAPLEKVPLDRPVAVVFGNEHRGADAEWFERGAEPFRIPMVGFVQSFNVSVSAAITMSWLTARARSECPDYNLPPAAQTELLGAWTARSVPTWQAEYNSIVAAQ